MVGKKCRLGKRNELGTRVFDFKGGEQDSVVWGYMGTMRRTTSLGREASLRLEMRITSEHSQRLKRAGMFKWQAYKDNRESINQTKVSRRAAREVQRAPAQVWALLPGTTQREVGRRGRQPSEAHAAQGSTQKVAARPRQEETHS